MCDSKWVFSNSVLFGENNPSWSALFSHDTGRREKNWGFIFLSSHGSYLRSHLTTAGPLILASTGRSHHYKVLKKHVCRSKITHFI